MPLPHDTARQRRENSRRRSAHAPNDIYKSRSQSATGQQLATAILSGSRHGGRAAASPKAHVLQPERKLLCSPRGWPASPVRHCSVAVSGLTASVASAAATLQGAGSTLVAPIEAEWAAAWANQTGNPTHLSGRRLGHGAKDIGSGLVDFGAPTRRSRRRRRRARAASRSRGRCRRPASASTSPGSTACTSPAQSSPRSTSGRSRSGTTAGSRRSTRARACPTWRSRRCTAADGSGDSYAFTDYLSRRERRVPRPGRRATKPTVPGRARRDRKQRDGDRGGHSRGDRVRRGLVS